LIRDAGIGDVETRKSPFEVGFRVLIFLLVLCIPWFGFP